MFDNVRKNKILRFHLPILVSRLQSTLGGAPRSLSPPPAQPASTAPEALHCASRSLALRSEQVCALRNSLE